MRAAQLSLVLALVRLLGACAHDPPDQRIPPTGLGDASRGRAYAEAVCASCHSVVGAGAASPNPLAPPFAEIANAPGMTQLALDVWLHSPHPNMPHFMVDEPHIEDLSAYLATLRD